MSRGRPSSRSVDLARVVVGAMRDHLGPDSTDVELARLLGIPQPSIARAMRLGLTPGTAAEWGRAWAAAGHPAIEVSVVVDAAGERATVVL